MFLHRMVLCIATQDSHSLNHLSLRFGASLKSCRHLLENAKKNHVEVVGVRCAMGASHPAQARLITLSPGNYLWTPWAFGWTCSFATRVPSL